MWCSSCIAPTFRQSFAIHALCFCPSHSEHREQPNFIIGVYVLVCVFEHDFFVVEKKTLCIHQTSQIFSNAVDSSVFVCVCLFFCLALIWNVGWIISFLHECFCGATARKNERTVSVEVIYILKSLGF